MKYLILLLSLQACGLKKQAAQSDFWQSRAGNTLFFAQNHLEYYNFNKNCHITGTFEKTYDNYLNWSLEENTCGAGSGEQECYFAVSYLKEHANFVCNGLNISEAFYRSR